MGRMGGAGHGIGAHGRLRNPARLVTWVPWSSFLLFRRRLCGSGVIKSTHIAPAHQAHTVAVVAVVAVAHTVAVVAKHTH